MSPPPAVSVVLLPWRISCTFFFRHFFEHDGCLNERMKKVKISAIVLVYYSQVDNCHPCTKEGHQAIICSSDFAGLSIVKCLFKEWWAWYYYYGTSTKRIAIFWFLHYGLPFIAFLTCPNCSNRLKQKKKCDYLKRDNIWVRRCLPIA